jgi:hypothetical protein
MLFSHRTSTPSGLPFHPFWNAFRNRPTAPVCLLRTLLPLTLITAACIAGCQTSPARPTSTTSRTSAAPPAPATDDAVPSVELETLANVDERIAALGAQPKADTLADLLQTLDTWDVAPTDEPAFMARKTEQIARLRRTVRDAVLTMQSDARSADSLAKGLPILDESRRVLNLYPMSNDPAVIREATELSRAQTECAADLQTKARQRYNIWAIDQIDASLHEYVRLDKRSLRIGITKDDAPALVKSFSTLLGPIDPLLLEPVTQDLYNYAIGRANKQLEEDQRTRLAKALNDPRTTRRALREF